MCLFVTALNSGSNGNCYYIGNENEAILIDAGISCKEIEKRMDRLSLSINKLKAIFISHEHTDHIFGLRVLTKKYSIPVYITPPTLANGRINIGSNLVVSFKAHQAIAIGELIITAFPKFHDASDPYSFVVDCKGTKVGVFTDIGTPCNQVIQHFSQCHAAFLEANYDEQMLKTGNYPYYLKARIRGGMGHLSNKQALNIFKSYKPAFMSHLFLSHLSQNNNCPKLVEQLFNVHAGTVKMVVTSRYKETEVYQITSSGTHQVPIRQNNQPHQLSLFD